MAKGSFNDTEMVATTEGDKREVGTKGNSKGTPRNNNSRRKNNGSGRQDRGKSGYSGRSDRNSIYGRLVELSTNISYYTQLGSSINNYIAPGIIQLYYLPAIGRTTDQSDPMNTTSKEFYSKVNSENSRTPSYNHPDLMIMLWSMASAYQYWKWMCRAYRALKTHMMSNRYAEWLPEACGVKHTEYRRLDDFESYIHTYELRFNQLPVAATVQFMTTCDDLLDGVYMDTEAAFGKAQIYAFEPFGFYQYDEMTSGQGTKAVLKPLPMANRIATPMNLDAIMDYGDNLLSALQVSEDVYNIMGADLLRAGGKQLQLPAFDASVPLPVVYSDAMLDAIHNATLIGVPYAGAGNDYSSWAITQNVDQLMIESNSRFVTDSGMSYWREYPSMVDTVLAEPTNADTLNITRFITRMEAPQMQDGKKVLGIESNGPIVMLYGQIFGYPKDGYNSGNIRFESSYKVTSESAVNYAYLAEKLSKFNRHPLLYSFQTKTVGQDEHIDKGVYFGDLANYTVISRDTMAKIHDAVTYSLYRTIDLK